MIIVGARGRMGARLCELALSEPGMLLAGAIVREGSESVGKPVAAERAGSVRYSTFSVARGKPSFPSGVLVDFSSPLGAVQSAELAVDCVHPLVVGTTALGEQALMALRAASTRVPVLVCSNTSLGVAVMAQTISTIAAMLGPRYDCSIVESHHRAKKDAPSGTAQRLARAVREAGHALNDDQVVAIRGGDVVGEHTVRFAGPGELIEVTHRATSRDVFARGALHAAAWLAGQKPGWYTIEDSLKNAAGSRQVRG